jgi:hypothetical protein
MNRARSSWLRWRLFSLVSVVAFVGVGVSGGCQQPGAKPAEQVPKADQPRATGKDSAQVFNRPATPKTKYAYARILAAQGQESPCEAVLTRLIAEEPRFTPAYLLLAEVRMRSRRIEDAMSALFAGLRVSPQDDVLWNDLGICFMMKSDCESALSSFTKAAALQPSNARYRSNMGCALGLMGRREESFSLYAMVLPPTDAQHNVSVLTSARGTYLGLDAQPLPLPAADPIIQQPIVLPECEEPLPPAVAAPPAPQPAVAPVSEPPAPLLIIEPVAPPPVVVQPSEDPGPQQPVLAPEEEDCVE